MRQNLRKLVLTALLTAIAVVGGTVFQFPLGAARVAPTQHLVNVISGILVGPWYALAQAFMTSLIRNLLGTGTILAFPGSMVGALLVGLTFQKTKRLWTAVLAELVGDGILGALLAFPLASLFLGTKGALWLFIPAFLPSVFVGVAIAYVLLKALWPAIVHYDPSLSLKH
ncbi:energy coupling factor transporter S component ThiW [Loigolactobacillus bifermentans]|uniref:ThiW protein n=1 Tax=Loigolactobacillus bifermentans DSM 20003 TaxID=1423726 RepID=A0A0R1GED1_9LACO|nr:energy coupling factor transporter S component ThiW [Loigolactobacillus bifermentans]KRK32453.1 thiW protein [Loigolactobacillus bifermentans DSM 20003]QGG59763.1 energy coupling factor transporter S component ThiW [Loigolactobacillus bifermentans]